MNELKLKLNRLSPIHWLRVAAGAVFGALFIFNDSGPFPVFKPRAVEARVTPLEADRQVLERFAASLRTIWAGIYPIGSLVRMQSGQLAVVRPGCPISSPRRVVQFRAGSIPFDDKACRSPMKLRYRLFGGIALIALAMLATIPGRGLRSHLARVRLFAGCTRELKQISELSGSCKSEYLTQTLAERPLLIGVAMWPYVNRCWSAAQRFAALQGHYPELEGYPGLRIGTQERVLVSDLGNIVPGLTIAIDRPDWFMREGELTINLFKEGFRAYSLAFTFGRVAGQRVLYVGCIQGRHAQGIDQLYRDLTKKLHGWRPRDVMVSLVQMIGAATDVSKIYLVSDDARVHRHRYFGDRHEGLISANYDEIWTEHGAVAVAGGFFELGTGIHRREPHEMAPNKRAIYRRRYELMDALTRDMASAISTRGVVSAVQSSRDESVVEGIMEGVVA